MPQPNLGLTAATLDEPPLVIVYGGGGHGRTLVELIRTDGTYRVAGVVDRSLPPGSALAGTVVLGGDEDLAALRAGGVDLAVNGVGGIARAEDRLEAFERLAANGFGFPALAHPSAVVEPSASLGSGSQVLAQAYVGTEAVVGFGCLLNTAAVVSHNCVLAEHVTISPGTLLAGDVRVGRMARLGMGVTVNLGITIGEGARVNNGAVVKGDVPAGQVVPAGSVWPPRSR